MSNRTAVIALAVITGCVSIFSITSSVNAAPAASDGATQAADECLAAPKAATPKGAHWYYRVEKGTKRKCWYLADEVAKTKKAAEPAPAPSDAAEQDVPPPTQIAPAPKQQDAKKPMQKSVADARAELTAGTPEDDSTLSETTWPPLTPSDRDAVQDDNQTAAIQPAPEAETRQGWSIAARWPDPATASDQPAAAAPASAAPALTPDRLATAAVPAPASPVAATAQPQPAADAAAPEAPLRIILSVLVCVLALGAILGPVLFKYFRPRPREDERSQRRPIWDTPASGRTILQDNPPPEFAPRYPQSLPEPRMLDEADEIEQLLARASKRSAA